MNKNKKGSKTQKSGKLQKDVWEKPARARTTNRAENTNRPPVETEEKNKKQWRIKQGAKTKGK